MYRCAKMTGKWYVLEVESVEDDAEQADEFVSGGTIVVYCDDIESFNEEMNDDAEVILVDE